MLPRETRIRLPVVAALGVVFLIGGSVDAAAQQPGRGLRPAAPAPVARPAAPAPHVSAPAMARPAAPAFHAAPAMQHPAVAPQPMPHFAAPRSNQHEAIAPRVPSAASRSTSDISTTPPPAARPASAALSRQERTAQRAQAREQRTQQQRQTEQERQQLTQQRQRDTLSRQSAERQNRIDRLQKHVQQLQAQQGRGRGAQRELQAQQRLLEREQSAQQRDLVRQQKLGAAPVAPQRAAAATQNAARGRFAARFHNNADPRTQTALTARLNGWAPRNAWRHRVRAAFIPWLGPLFWPYAYADIFDYTFWPSAYDDAYWAYAYDDFVDTLFWDVGSPYSAYASIAPEGYLEPGSAMVGSSRLRERSGLSPQALRQLCSNPDKGVTAWPFADIARLVRPAGEQRELLDQLKRAAARAAETLKNSCSEDYALTPPGRLQAMINRISATLEAVRIVRPALEAFNNSLGDEQQARFNTLGPQLPSSPEDRSQQEANANRESCGAPKASLTLLPIERINTVLHPTGAQKDALDRLSAATEKSVHVLQKACPYEVPLTPIGRLQVMEKRLSAMLEAANLVQPPLNEFYASLTSEQKARFNTLQQVAGP